MSHWRVLRSAIAVVLQLDLLHIIPGPCVVQTHMRVVLVAARIDVIIRPILCFEFPCSRTGLLDKGLCSLLIGESLHEPFRVVGVLPRTALDDINGGHRCMPARTLSDLTMLYRIKIEVVLWPVTAIAVA